MDDQRTDREGKRRLSPRFSIAAMLASIALAAFGTWLLVMLFTFIVPSGGSASLGVGLWFLGCAFMGAAILLPFGRPFLGAFLAIVLQIPIILLWFVYLAFNSPHII